MVTRQCGLKIRCIFHYQKGKLQHWFFWINQPHLTQMTIQLFLVAYRLGLALVAVCRRFWSYLTDHIKCIKINPTLSEPRRLLYGVLQGSVMGPILFSLCTIPISKITGRHPFIKFHFYADDRSLYTLLIKISLNRCLDDVNCGYRQIGFFFKCTTKQLKSFLPVNIHGKLLHIDKICRYLEVTFDSNFSFSRHVQCLYGLFCTTEGS